MAVSGNLGDFSVQNAEIIDLGDGVQNQVVALWPMTVVFDLNVPATQIWATIGSNCCTCTVTAYGTLGEDSFSTYWEWLPGTRNTITGIGDIYKMTAFNK